MKRKNYLEGLCQVITRVCVALVLGEALSLIGAIIASLEPV